MKIRRSAANRTLVVVLAAATILGLPLGADDSWPRWRGAASDGTARTTGSALDRPFELRVRWRRSLGTGYSGVVVAEGSAVTMFSDGSQDYLVALDADDGSERWRLTLGEAFPPRDGSTGGPVSTPAIADGVVYALGPRGALVAARLASGEPLWRRELASELGAVTPHWGFTTSPLVAGDRLVVLTGGAPDRAVSSFDRRTGATVWRAGSDDASYQSPILVRLAGADAIVVGGDRLLLALDPRDGRLRWSHEHGGEGFFAKIINPVRVGSDGLLLNHKPDGSTLLRVASAPEPVWTTRELKANYATPLVHGELVVGYSGRLLAAVDARDGAPLWRSREPGDGFPILVDGHLAVLTKRGTLAVGEASREGWREEASLALFRRLVWTPPSFAAGRFYARDSYEEIAAVDVVPTARAGAAPASAGVADTWGRATGSEFARWVASTEGAADAPERVRRWLAEHPISPVVEDGRWAHIVYAGPEADVALRADVLEVGDERRLHRIAGTDLRYASIELPRDGRVAYQLLLDLDRAVVDPRNPAKNTSLTYPGDVSIAAMPAAPPLLAAAPAELRGKLVALELETPEVVAEHLKWGGKRAVEVYLPPGYESAPERRYPTVFVFYGEQMSKDAGLAALLDREIGRSLPPLLAVFVASTSGFEYARTFREPHAKMVAAQLVPWIDRQFRTLADPAQRVLVGADEAGYAAVEIGLRHPRLFGGVVAQSIFALTGGDQELLALVDHTPVQGQRFHLDWGRFDPRRSSDGLDVPGFTRTVHDRLAARGHQVGGREWNDGSTMAFLGERIVLALGELLPAP